MLATVCAVALSLAACSSSNEKSPTLPSHTGDSATGSSPTSSVPAASPTPVSSASSTKAAGKTQTFTIRRGKLPAGLTGEAAAAAKAWLAYWEYLAVADSIAAIDPATSGSVMTGRAATKAHAYVAKLKRTKTHVIGSVGVDMTSALVAGSTATLCGRLQMRAFEFNARGQPAESTVPTVLFFKGTAVKTGPKWRISDYVNLRKPC